MAVTALIRQRFQPWQFWLCAGIGGYLALSAATNTFRSFHWYLLLVVPVALFGSDWSKRFFIDWSPLFAFWLVYDRLRLVQPLLLDRVAVAWPYRLEQVAFGWLTAGEVPAHFTRSWLASHSGTLYGDSFSLAAQFIYLSHLFLLPLILLYFWVRGFKSDDDRRAFTRYMRGFAVLHGLAILIYMLLPVAPPWWVSLYGTIRPTPELVSATQMTAAMDGVIVQGLIRSASNWFAAVPSLHGAYPVLMLLFASENMMSRRMFGLLLAYAAGMFA
ncbi:MAG TPA: phosphatase PAP2 family protein, partial [Blastocatellia bacterium]|nr:phosphatase PAP2 family protein [Blastocatellia bacterium]